MRACRARMIVQVDMTTSKNLWYSMQEVVLTIKTLIMQWYWGDAQVVMIVNAHTPHFQFVSYLVCNCVIFCILYKFHVKFSPRSKKCVKSQKKLEGTKKTIHGKPICQNDDCRPHPLDAAPFSAVYVPPRSDAPCHAIVIRSTARARAGADLPFRNSLPAEQVEC